MLALFDGSLDESAMRQCIYGPEVAADVPCPATNPGSWITTDDYPSSSLRNGEQGTVEFRLEIDTRGSPTSCTVIDPSASATLNEVTCNLLMARAHFVPLRDEDGDKVRGTYSSSVRWEIPEQTGSFTMMLPHNVEFLITVGPNGRITDCQIVRIDMNGLQALAGTVPSEEEYCANVEASGFMPIAPENRARFPQTFRVRNSMIPELRL